jgi:hypothetical protein
MVLGNNPAPLKKEDLRLGAKQELEIIRGFILFEKEKANWEDFYKFVEKRLAELQKGDLK